MKLFLLSLLFIVHTAFAQKNTYIGQLSIEELDSLKKFVSDNFKIEADSSTIVIHYYQPQKFCHYNNYNRDPVKTVQWFYNYYKENNVVFPDNVKMLFSYYNESYKQKWYNSLFVYDEGHYIHKLILSKKRHRSCECILIMNSEGKIAIKYGEWTPTDLNYMLVNIK